MREDDRTGVSETRPDRQYRMPPCPIHSQFRVVGHDLGGRTHRTCPLSDFEPRSTWLKRATWEIPYQSNRAFDAGHVEDGETAAEAEPAAVDELGVSVEEPGAIEQKLDATF